MPQELLPDDIRDMVLGHIDSVAQLEALLFLREHASEWWAVAVIAQRLYASEGEIASSLARLNADGFTARNGDTYRYECSTAHDHKVTRLAAAYARQLIPITNLIHAKPRNIRKFSDAFKFRADD